MSVRKVLPILGLSTLLAFGGAACGDRTVTTTPRPTSVSVRGDGVASAEVDLAEVDRLLRDIESDLSAADQDAATPEGDPAQ
jgi:hypothetical protein